MSATNKVPQYICYQCLCAWGELQLPSISPGDSLRRAVRSGLGSYQVTSFALCSGASEILCVPLKSEVSIFPSPVGLLQLSPTGLQSQMLWGLISWCETSRLESLAWGSELSLLWENPAI